MANFVSTVYTSQIEAEASGYMPEEAREKIEAFEDGLRDAIMRFMDEGGGDELLDEASRAGFIVFDLKVTPN